MAKNEMGWACGTYKEGETYKWVLVGKAGRKGSLEVPGVDGRIVLRHMFRKGNGVECSGLIWLRIGRGDELF
jgi:hypothetical protein